MRANATNRRMPELCAVQRGTRHTLDSALPTLEQLGVTPDRVAIRFALGEGRANTVVGQDPAPGTTLDEHTRVVLRIAGVGVHDALPYAMRDEHSTEFRADALCALFDGPLAKAGRHMREGGGYFALRPDRPLTALRWIEELFGLDASCWAPQRWYAVARLLPSLHRIAGRPDGISLALASVFELPVARVVTRAVDLPLSSHERTRLGVANTRLAVDAVAGVGLRVVGGIELIIGPLSRARYLEHATPGERLQRDALYRLLLPVQSGAHVNERWLIGTPAAVPKLEHNGGAALGLDSYLAASPNWRTP